MALVTLVTELVIQQVMTQLVVLNSEIVVTVVTVVTVGTNVALVTLVTN